MGRRLFALLLTVPVALVLVGGTAWLLWPRTAITSANAARLKTGMRLPEVEAVLGGPARDDSTGPLEADEVQDDQILQAWVQFSGKRDSVERADLLSSTNPRWTSDSVIIIVGFSDDGTVASVLQLKVHRVEEDFFTMLRRYLRL